MCRFAYSISKVIHQWERERSPKGVAQAHASIVSNFFEKIFLYVNKGIILASLHASFSYDFRFVYKRCIFRDSRAEVRGLRP